MELAKSAPVKRYTNGRLTRPPSPGSPGSATPRVWASSGPAADDDRAVRGRLSGGSADPPPWESRQPNSHARVV
ncbi:hypothetical protein VTN77DRAFT_1067 [Rasamsonia byssochlamydoides]|uniref:uncharacterized protein n=1 Tax=Rasamsonia byssochlamydoides TaxID=89139 RepID=UPI0037446C29